MPSTPPAQDPAVPAPIRDTLETPLSVAAGKEEPEAMAEGAAAKRSQRDEGSEEGGSDRTVVDGEEGSAGRAAVDGTAGKGEEAKEEGTTEVRLFRCTGGRGEG